MKKIILLLSILLSTTNLMAYYGDMLKSSDGVSIAIATSTIPVFIQNIGTGTYTNNSVTVFSTATTVQATLSANTTYHFDIYALIQTTTTTTGVFITCRSTQSFISMTAKSVIPASATTQITNFFRTNYGGTTGTGVDVINQNLLGTIEGVIVTSGTPTTFGLMFRSELANQIVNVKDGSYIRCYEVK